MDTSHLQSPYLPRQNSRSLPFRSVISRRTLTLPRRLQSYQYDQCFRPTIQASVSANNTTSPSEPPIYREKMCQEKTTFLAGHHPDWTKRSVQELPLQALSTFLSTFSLRGSRHSQVCPNLKSYGQQPMVATIPRLWLEISI